MVPLLSLWLPVLSSAVIVFVASAILHAVLPVHRNDFKKVPSEDDVMAALRGFKIPPGDFEIPHASTPKERAAAEFTNRAKQGPNALLTVIPGPPNMGKLLGFWFVYCIVVSVFSAYVAGSALAPAADYLSVFRFAGCTAFAGYSIGIWQDVIWAGRSATTALKNTIDGLIYALLTAGTFGWLWPGA